jgi:hypothetical protein
VLVRRAKSDLCGDCLLTYGAAFSASHCGFRRNDRQDRGTMVGTAIPQLAFFESKKRVRAHAAARACAASNFRGSRR